MLVERHAIEWDNAQMKLYAIRVWRFICYGGRWNYFTKILCECYKEEGMYYS